MPIQNLWGTDKIILSGKFIMIQAHLSKEEKLQINNLTLYPKELENEEKIKANVTRRK